MSYHLTMLAYDMNGEPLSFGHGAPVRLRNEIQLGFKQVKWIAGIEFVADYSEIGGGYGGYNEDHEFFRISAVDLACHLLWLGRPIHAAAVPTRAPVTDPNTRPTATLRSGLPKNT